MMKFEPWPTAYERILHEVQEELANRDEADQYAEYRRRCEAWKQERGIR